MEILNNQLTKQLENKILSHPIFSFESSGKLAVVIAHFNPCNYISPLYNLLKTFDNLLNFDLNIFIGEVLCGERFNTPSIFPRNHNRIFSCKSTTVWFHKEMIWNCVEKIIPERYSKIVFLDGDLLFPLEANMFLKIEEELNHYKFVHPYSLATYLDVDGNLISNRHSAGWAFTNHKPEALNPRKYHNGFGIAVDREFFNYCGGFFPSILGDGDSHVLGAAAGIMDYVKLRLLSVSEAYWAYYQNWAGTVNEWTKGSLGYVDGEVCHLFHGNLVDRDYDGRLRRIHGFNPYLDTKINGSTGLLEWSDNARMNKQSMIQSVNGYFYQRNEDSRII